MCSRTVFTCTDEFNFSIHNDNGQERIHLEIQTEHGLFKYWLTSMNGNNQEIITYLQTAKLLFDRKEPNLSFHLTHDKERENDLFLELFGSTYLPILHVFGNKF